MGKSKEPKPEPEKIVRISGENLSIAVSESEKKYRNKHGPDDVTDLSKDKIKCTVCAKSVADILKKGVEPYVHTVLGVLMCKDCVCFYGDGYFSADEDGDDKYCRWCGQGGTLYLCSACTCAFCKKCIKQNLNKQDVQDLESDDWHCLICNPKPLFECRTICWALQEFAKTRKEERDEKEEPTHSKWKQEKGQKPSEPTGSRKRKANEMDDLSERDQDRKRQKSEGSASKKSRRNSTKEVEISDDDKPKKNSKIIKRRGSRQEEETTPNKRPSRSSKKSVDKSTNKTPEEIVISDDEDAIENKKSVVEKKKSSKSVKSSPKKSPLSKQSNQSKTRSVEIEEKKDRPKRVTAEKSAKDSKINETPPKKSSLSKDKKSSKKKKTSVNDVDLENETSGKRNPRVSKSRGSKSVNYDDCDSKSESDLTSESESKMKTSKYRPEAKESSKTKHPKSKLPLGKNADSKVVQASKYINSALKDVLELSVLISSRCEKLCSKSVHSNDDVLSVFSKLKQLVSGVHTNLELIEKGLDTKISGWKSDNEGDTKNEGEKCADNILIDKDEKPKENILSQDDEEKYTNECINRGNSLENKEQVVSLEEDEDKDSVKLLRRNSEDKMEIDSDSQETVSIKAAINEIKDVLYTKSECDEDESILEKLKSTEAVNCSNEKTSEINEDVQETSTKKEDVNLETDEPEEKLEPSCKDNEDENNDAASEVQKCRGQIVDGDNQNVEENPEKNPSIPKEKECENNKCKNEEVQNSEINDQQNKVEKKNSDDERNCERGIIENENLVQSIVENEDNESSNDHKVLDDCDIVINDSVESAVKSSGTQNKGMSDFDSVNNEDASDTTSTKQEEEVCQNDDNSVTETDSELSKIIEERSGYELTKEDITSPATQSTEIKQVKNGSSEGEKNRLEIKEESKGEPKEQPSVDKKEDSNPPNTTSENHKSSSRVQESHSDDHNRRYSGDKSRHSQDNSRWSGERSRDWDRQHDRYRSDGWPRSQRGGSWNRYDNRHPGRGGWGWNR